VLSVDDSDAAASAAGRASDIGDRVSWRHGESQANVNVVVGVPLLSEREHVKRPVANDFRNCISLVAQRLRVEPADRDCPIS